MVTGSQLEALRRYLGGQAAAYHVIDPVAGLYRFRRLEKLGWISVSAFLPGSGDRGAADSANEREDETLVA
jgi:hypothetical protein